MACRNEVFLLTALACDTGNGPKQTGMKLELQIQGRSWSREWTRPGREADWGQTFGIEGEDERRSHGASSPRKESLFRCWGSVPCAVANRWSLNSLQMTLGGDSAGG